MLLTESWAWWPGVPKKSDYGLLPRGKQTLGGIEFDLRGYIRMGNDWNVLDYPRFPDQVSAIRVGQRCKKLHFLQAGSETSGSPLGTPVGHYIVHYGDGGQLEIPILFGIDLADWSADVGAIGAKTKTERATVVWTGSNREENAHRLCLMTWQNPHPDVVVESLDAVAEKCSIHLAAITAEPVP
jgi:hypothetical protein